MAVFHICPATDWQQAQRRGEYRAGSLATEGFIHASTAAQVAATADRFYRGRPGLVLLRIDENRLPTEVRYEAADGGLFPHIYGVISLHAVTGVFPFVPAADGTFRLPEGTEEERVVGEEMECPH